MSLLIKELHTFLFAYFIFAVLTLEHLVGALPEPFGVFDKGDLPSDQEYHRREEQAPCEEISDEKHGCEDHEIAPVEYPAVYAAAILYQVSLERTPDDHTDQITYEVCA